MWSLCSCSHAFLQSWNAEQTYGPYTEEKAEKEAALAWFRTTGAELWMSCNRADWGTQILGNVLMFWEMYLGHMFCLLKTITPDLTSHSADLSFS